MKKEIKKTIWLWAILGFIVGGWIGLIIAGLLGLCVGAATGSMIAWSSSAKNGGGPPSWLWPSRKK